MDLISQFKIAHPIPVFINGKKRTAKTCKFCGKEFYIELSEARRGNGNYCSKSCTYRAFPRKPKAEPRISTCKSCGAEFKFVLLKHRPGRRFCSVKCWYQYRRDNEKLASCKTCQKSFVRTYPKDKFCSRACLLRDRGSLKICKQCGNEYHQAPSRCLKFCNDYCYRKYQASLSIDKECLGCGKTYNRGYSAAAKKSKYCSRECQFKHFRGANNPLYRGRRSADRGDTWKERQQQARSRDLLCQSFIHDASRPIARKEKLSVDHIVAYSIVKKFCPESDPNDLRNLICLCRWCHIKKTTGAEVKLVRGDVLGFLSEMNKFMDISKVKVAMSLYGL